MWTPLNDSGIVAESLLPIINTDSENDVVKEIREDLSSNTNPERPSVIKQKYQKPPRPCLFSNKVQTQLKRHILKKHEKYPEVEPILSMNVKERDRIIAQFRRRAIKQFNLALIKEGGRGKERRQAMTLLLIQVVKGFLPRSTKIDINWYALRQDQT